MRWHLDRARERIAGLQLHERPGIVIHGDFTPRNLHFQDARLSGVLDFELARWDHRSADFVLARRGKYDEVVHGYHPVLALVRWAVRGAGLALICFDRRHAPTSWAERDRWMALHLLAGWSLRCPRGKVLAISGNLHARLHNRPPRPTLWPSCAAQLRALLPRRQISSITIQFRRGAFFNGGLRTIGGAHRASAVEPTLADDPAFTQALALPLATAVAHLAAPPQW